MEAWASAFLLTQLVEVPLQAVPLAGSRARRWGLAFLSSCWTHPVLWYVLTAWVRPTWPAILAAELLVVFVEGAWLHLLGARRAWAWALLANASSVAVGTITRHFFHWP